MYSCWRCGSRVVALREKRFWSGHKVNIVWSSVFDWRSNACKHLKLLFHLILLLLLTLSSYYLYRWYMLNKCVNKQLWDDPYLVCWFNRNLISLDLKSRLSHTFNRNLSEVIKVWYKNKSIRNQKEMFV